MRNLFEKIFGLEFKKDPQEIIDYIKKRRESGMTDNAIKSELLKANWTEADIDAALSSQSSSDAVSNSSPTLPNAHKHMNRRTIVEMLIILAISVAIMMRWGANNTFGLILFFIGVIFNSILFFLILRKLKIERSVLKIFILSVVLNPIIYFVEDKIVNVFINRGYPYRWGEYVTPFFTIIITAVIFFFILYFAGLLLWKINRKSSGIFAFFSTLFIFGLQFFFYFWLAVSGFNF